MTILWNEVTIWWNEVTKGWNEVALNEVVMERSDRNSLGHILFVLILGTPVTWHVVFEVSRSL